MTTTMKLRPGKRVSASSAPNGNPHDRRECDRRQAHDERQRHDGVERRIAAEHELQRGRAFGHGISPMREVASFRILVKSGKYACLHRIEQGLGSAEVYPHRRYEYIDYEDRAYRCQWETYTVYGEKISRKRHSWSRIKNGRIGRAVCSRRSLGARISAIKNSLKSLRKLGSKKIAQNIAEQDEPGRL